MSAGPWPLPHRNSSAIQITTQSTIAKERPLHNFGGDQKLSTLMSEDRERRDSDPKSLPDSLMEDARAGTEHQQRMTVKEAFRRYPMAVAWSVLFSTAIVMEGYDMVMINSFFAQPQFNQYFGSLQSDGKYRISAAWQSSLANAVQVGSIIGVMCNGILVDKFGYKKVMAAAVSSMICLIFITFFAQNLPMLFIGELLCGLPWGIFQTLTTAYASEVCPVPLRPYLTTYVNLCWVFGQFIASGVLRGVFGIQGEYGWRIPFAVQWVWPIPIVIGVALAPESPWWLVRQGRVEDARKSVRRLTTRLETDENVNQTVAMIQHTNNLEMSVSSGTSYLDCFKSVDRRRTEISAITWFIQAFCGASVMGFSTYFYQQAGLPDEKAFDMTMIQYALGAVGTISSWYTLQRFGRRPLYLWGLIALESLLILTGVLGSIPQSRAIAWAIGTCLLIFTFVYDLTIGPVCYCIVAEISSTRLRAKTIVLSRNLYNIGGILNNVIVPRMLNPDAWNLGAKTAYFFAGVNAFLIVWTYFRLPEPAGRTYGELDVLFENKVPARLFSKTVGDQYIEKNHADIKEKEKDDDLLKAGMA